MLLHLGNLFLFSLVLVNLLGLTLGVGLWLRNAWIAIASGPLILCTLIFPIECWHGLGDLYWVLPLSTGLSIWLITEVEREKSVLNRLEGYIPISAWKEALSLSANPTPYIIFLLLFAYSMSWRYFRPEIEHVTELIADLSHVCAFMSGKTIPVEDYWYAPLTSTHYYCLQYYAAGLLGRIFHLDPGTTYNVSFATCCAYAFFVSVGVVWALSSRFLIRLLVSLNFILGGTGVTLFLAIFKKTPYLWDYQRFIGNADLDTDYGRFLVGYNQSYTDQELPGESLGYSVFLGDYHPVLSGFYILGFAVLVAVFWVKYRVSNLLYLLGAAVPWCFLADTWNLPILGIPLVAFVFYHSPTLLEDGSWKKLVFGTFAVFTLFFPYFMCMATGSVDIPVTLKWVAWNQHAPPLSYLLYFLPTIGMILLCLTSWDTKLVTLGLLMAVLMAFTEFFFGKDIYPGVFDRFNTTLKWWPCVSQLTLIILVPLFFERYYQKTRSLEYSGLMFPLTLAGFFLIYPIFYGFELAKVMDEDLYYRYHGWGRMDGSYLLTGNIIGYDDKDGCCYLEGEKWVGWKYDWDNPLAFKWLPDNNYCYLGICNYTDWEIGILRLPSKIYCNNRRFFLENIKALPKDDVFVERPGDDFTDYGLMTLLSNHRNLIGWVGHEELWRGTPPTVRYRYNNVKKLYDGTLLDAGNYLSIQGVDIILWFKKEDKSDLWVKVNDTVKNRYVWYDFLTEDNGNKIGYWRRIKDPSDTMSPNDEASIPAQTPAPATPPPPPVAPSVAPTTPAATAVTAAPTTATPTKK